MNNSLANTLLARKRIRSALPSGASTIASTKRTCNNKININKSTLHSAPMDLMEQDGYKNHDDFHPPKEMNPTSNHDYDSGQDYFHEYDDENSDDDDKHEYEEEVEGEGEHHKSELVISSVPENGDEWYHVDNSFTHNIKLEIFFHYKRPSCTEDMHITSQSILYKPLYAGCGPELTQESFRQKISEFTSKHNFNNVVLSDLLELISFILPPECKASYTSIKDPRASLNLPPSATVNHKRIYKYDCCLEEHYVFTNKVEDICPVCSKSRFTEGSHRTSRKQLCYRSLCLLICDLLTTRDFLSSINYRFVEHVIGEGFIADGFQHGSVPKQHMMDMHNRFLQHQADPSAISSCLEVSLVLIVYYDGVQLFKRRVVHFWPLLVSILNLPPNLRKLYGAGLFSLSLLAVEPGSKAECFVMDLFVQELKMLYDGFRVHINGQDYFVQARIVSHVYDTRAVEKVLNSQSAGSTAGCPFCRLVPG
jgi:hypothetical protein